MHLNGVVYLIRCTAQLWLWWSDIGNPFIITWCHAYPEEASYTWVSFWKQTMCVRIFSKETHTHTHTHHKTAIPYQLRIKAGTRSGVVSELGTRICCSCYRVAHTYVLVGHMLFFFPPRNPQEQRELFFYMGSIYKCCQVFIYMDIRDRAGSIILAPLEQVI